MFGYPCPYHSSLSTSRWRWLSLVSFNDGDFDSNLMGFFFISTIGQYFKNFVINALSFPHWCILCVYLRKPNHAKLLPYHQLNSKATRRKRGTKRRKSPSKKQSSLTSNYERCSCHAQYIKLQSFQKIWVCQCFMCFSQIRISISWQSNITTYSVTRKSRRDVIALENIIHCCFETINLKQ